MRYVMLVSHGTFAPGLHDALKMLAGEGRENVISTSLENGMGSETYTENVRRSLQLLNEDGEPYLVLQDKLNEVFPEFLTAVFVILCWFLMAKKRLSPIKVMLLLVVIAFLGVVVGFFNPGLAY